MQQGKFVQYKKNLWIVDEYSSIVKLTGKNKGEILRMDDVIDQKKIVCVKIEIKEIK